MMAASSAGSTGPLCAGMLKLGVRWNTVSWSASLAIIGMDWMAEDPVPTTPTFLPLKSTG